MCVRKCGAVNVAGLVPANVGRCPALKAVMSMLKSRKVVSGELQTLAMPQAHGAPSSNVTDLIPDSQSVGH